MNSKNQKKHRAYRGQLGSCGAALGLEDFILRTNDQKLGKQVRGFCQGVFTVFKAIMTIPAPTVKDALDTRMYLLELALNDAYNRINDNSWYPHIVRTLLKNIIHAKYAEKIRSYKVMPKHLMPKEKQ